MEACTVKYVVANHFDTISSIKTNREIQYIISNLDESPPNLCDQYQTQLLP